MTILAMSSFESFIQLMGALLIFALVLILVYFTTRWMGGLQKNGMKGKNLRIVESIGVGTNKSICIIEAGTEYLVVAIGKEEINFLTSLSREQLKDFSFENDESKGFAQESFQDILQKLKEKHPGK